MKVAIVHDWLTGMRGGERVLEVLCQLFPTADIYTLFFFPQKISPAIKQHRIITSTLQKIPGNKNHYRKLLPFYPSAIESFDLTDYDLIVSTSHAVAKGAIPGGKSLSVCYCHTPMRYIWDMYDIYFKQKNISVFIRYAAPFFCDYLKFWDQETTDRVDYFIANSRFVAKRIETIYNRSAQVVHPPVNTSLFEPSGNSHDDYYLIVSALAPYKKLELAIEAFNKLGKRLVIIGSGPEKKRLESMRKDNIEFKGFIDNDQIVKEYYQNCRALIFPGIEDFGLTPLEAQACGRPVIAFAKGGALESVIEGVSGHFFHEQTCSSLVNAVCEFESMHFSSETLRHRALQYDISIMIRELKKVFNRIFQQNNLNFSFAETNRHVETKS